jgi:hypothetical protein
VITNPAVTTGISKHPSTNESSNQLHTQVKSTGTFYPQIQTFLFLMTLK